MKLFLKIFIPILLLACIAIGYALYYIAPYGIVMMVRYSLADLAKALDNKITPENYGLKSESLSITADDNILLKGWYIPSLIASGSTVIILHGINANKEEMLPDAKILSNYGFNVALFDSRGHGESGGTFCTFGYYEKKDISRIVDYLIGIDSSQKIAVYGTSLGGAIALQAMALDNRIKCGVVQSTFATLREVVSDYMQRMFFVGPMFLSNIALNRAGELAKFNPDDIQPELSAKNIENPVFVGHGDKDIHVNYNYGIRIYHNLKSTNKEWHLVRGADHATLGLNINKEYQINMISFLHRYIGE